MSSKVIGVIALAVAAALILAALWMCAPSGGEGEDTSPTAPATDSIYRVIGEWEGHVAVFLPQTETPETVYDTLLVTLPDEAREQLQAGVEVTNYEMLKRRLEDYLS